MALNAGTPIGFGSGTVSNTALSLADISGLTAALVDGADRVRLTVNSNALHFRYDGGDPTTSAGHQVPTNGTLILDGNHNLKALRLIRSGASDATVAITLERL
jgi:hypothetical protein